MHDCSWHPNVRAAHSHLYGIGEGKKLPVVKFLALGPDKSLAVPRLLRMPERLKVISQPIFAWAKLPTAKLEVGSPMRKPALS